MFPETASFKFEFVVPIPTLPFISRESAVFFGYRSPLDSLHRSEAIPDPVIVPKQVKFPVVESIVQPFEDAPFAKRIEPDEPGLIVRSDPAVDAEITGFDPDSVRAVEVKVFEFIVEPKVEAPETLRVLESVEAPVTARVEESVVAPSTVRVDATVDARVEVPDTFKVPDNAIESFSPTVTDDPSSTSPPPVRLVPALIVILLLVKAELGILVRVLSDPEIDLFFKVSVVSVPISVVDVPGRLNILAPDKIWFDVAESEIVPELTEEKLGDDTLLRS